MKNKISTNRVRQATDLEDQSKIGFEKQFCDETSHDIELNQNDNLYSTLENVSDPDNITSLECNGYNQVPSCKHECNDKHRKNDQMLCGLYQREGIALDVETEDLETNPNALPTW